MKLILRSGSFLILLLVFVNGCTSDVLPEPMLSEFCIDNTPTYDTNMKAIIDNNCSFNSDCHGVGSPNNEFTSYEGILPSLENGKVKGRVIDLQDMPPFPEELTEAVMDTLECWIQSGYPEN